MARADQPYASPEEVLRRAGAPVSSLERLAEADAFRASLGLGRREASWALKALRDHALPLFAAADEREGGLAPEIVEATVPLRPMTQGREVGRTTGTSG